MHVIPSGKYVCVWISC